MSNSCDSEAHCDILTAIERESETSDAQEGHPPHCDQTAVLQTSVDTPAATLPQDCSSVCQNHLSDSEKSVGISSKPKTNACGVCSMVFSQTCELKQHMKTHSGEKPFVCHVCGKTFSNAGNLWRHNLVHSGKKPFLCDYCGKGFNRASNLKRHHMTHTGEKPYACSVCDKAFSEAAKLRLHMRTHT